MLVITRKQDESFLVGDNVKISVVEISKDRVRIGIDAPKEIKIIRSELYDTEKLNMQAAFNKMPADLMNKLMSDRK